MRRTWRGWLPLLALLVVVGGAAWLGESMQPVPNGDLSRFLAATEAAGSARFTETMVVATGSKPFPSSHSSGVIDFRTDALRATLVQSNVTTTGTGSRSQTSVQWTRTREVDIGKTDFTWSPNSPSAGWTESNGNDVTPVQQLGFGLWLWFPTTPVAAAFVGPAVVRGVPTRRYRVVSPSDSCPSTTSIHTVIELWVDSRSRLVQTQITSSSPSLPVKLPALTNLPPALRRQFEKQVRQEEQLPLTITLQLSAFGTPVTITRPAPIESPPPPVGGSAQSISGGASTFTSGGGTLTMRHCSSTGTIGDRGTQRLLP